MPPAFSVTNVERIFSTMDLPSICRLEHIGECRKGAFRWKTLNSLGSDEPLQPGSLFCFLFLHPGYCYRRCRSQSRHNRVDGRCRGKLDVSAEALQAIPSFPEPVWRVSH